MLAGAAAWWERQEQRGTRVTGPARQIRAVIAEVGSSPTAGALGYELGRMVLGYSQLLAVELAGSGPEPSATVSRARPATERECPACGTSAEARAWSDHELEFLRVICRACRATAIASRTIPARGDDWALAGLQGDEPNRSFRIPGDATISAASLNGELLDLPVRRESGASAPVRNHPGGFRLVALLDLRPVGLTCGTQQ